MSTSCTVPWRQKLPVLVADAHAIGGVAIVRSLGRAGYPVHACSYRSDGLGLMSAYAIRSAVCPKYNEPEFVPWLRNYIKTHSIQAITPSEGMLLAMRPYLAEVVELLPLSKDPDVIFRGMSKYDVYCSLDTAGNGADNSLPPTIGFDSMHRAPTKFELRELGYPIFIKVDSLYATGSQPSRVIRVDSEDEAMLRLAQIREHYKHGLIQGFVPGVGVGAFFLIWKGRVLAEFMHRRLHEVPHTGGVSSLRESWYHAAIRQNALAKLRTLEWEGVAMMEYRWDPTSDKFFLMELNGRFWGSLHLALYSGIDFPVMLLDAFHGRVPSPANQYPLGVRCRYTFPKELQYVWSRLKDQKLSIPSRLQSVLEFFLLSINPSIYSDLWFSGDRKLYWESIRRFFRELH